MTELVSWYSVEQVPGTQSHHGYCLYEISLATTDTAVSCGHRTKKMGSVEKAESAISDHLRDVHGVDL